MGRGACIAHIASPPLGPPCEDKTSCWHHHGQAAHPSAEHAYCRPTLCGGERNRDLARILCPLRREMRQQSLRVCRSTAAAHAVKTERCPPTAFLPLRQDAARF